MLDWARERDLGILFCDDNVPFLLVPHESPLRFAAPCRTSQMFSTYVVFVVYPSVSFAVVWKISWVPFRPLRSNV